MSNSSPFEALTAGTRRPEWNGQHPRLVVLDADGTLLGREPETSPACADAIASLREAGVNVIIATGRNEIGVHDLIDQLDLPGPNIVLNGALMLESDAVQQRTWPVSRDANNGLLELCKAEGLYAELYLPDAVLVTEFDTRYAQHWEEVIGRPIGTVDDFPQYLDDVIKATVVVDDASLLDQVEAAILDHGLIPGVATSPAVDNLWFVNVTAATCDKGVAVTYVAEQLEIDLTAVAVIGDGGNDVPMLKIAGTAIAMGQATETTKSVAHFVTETFNNGGAATALTAINRWLRSEQ